MIRRSFTLETVTAIHVALLAICATWALGGNAPWAQTGLGLLASLSVVFTLYATRERLLSRRDSLQSLHWLWPLFGFNILVLLSAMHPLFRSSTIEGAEVMIPVSSSPWRPASADPATSLHQLWLLDGFYLSCFNLVLAVRRRRVIRILVLALAANAVILAVFGTLQQLTHASGLFFGWMPSPNVTFFASFIYHNHWGAFVVLMVAGALGLVIYAARQPGYRDLWHSPVLAGVVAVLVLAATAPLSSSRSCTLIVLLLLLWAFFQSLRHIALRGGKTARGAILGLVLATGLGGAAVYGLAKPVIESRVGDTKEQISHLRADKSLDSRMELYRDTWHMAQGRLALGWGLGGYPRVFMLYNTQQAEDRLPQYYEDAHSDWLQSLTEVGVIGSLLHASLFVLPLIGLRGVTRDPLALYLFLGCAAIALYALVEFPFGNAAVTLTFWFSFFCAVRLLQLNEREVSG